jgi:hypothetical protein
VSYVAWSASLAWIHFSLEISLEVSEEEQWLSRWGWLPQLNGGALPADNYEGKGVKYGARCTYHPVLTLVNLDTLGRGSSTWFLPPSPWLQAWAGEEEQRRCFVGASAAVEGAKTWCTRVRARCASVVVL